jgi:hypothetical protein
MDDGEEGGGGFGMARKDDWGGDRRTGDGEPKRVNTGFDSKDLKKASSYERERYGKREFKGKSPLATSKGSTLVAREGLVHSLKKKFGKNIKDKSILSEDTLIDE